MSNEEEDAADLIAQLKTALLVAEVRWDQERRRAESHWRQVIRLVGENERLRTDCARKPELSGTTNRERNAGKSTNRDETNG